MQFPTLVKPPVGIVFDSAMGERIDDALALAMLFTLQRRFQARLISISVSRSNLKSAAFCDAVRRFYLAPGLAIGMSESGKMAEDTAMVSVPLARSDAEGNPVYPHDIRKRNDTAEVSALIRNALTAQVDQNAIVLLTGPATELARLLNLPGAREVIVRKAKLLVVAAGAFPEGRPEFNIATDIPAAKKLFAEWPTPIVAVGRDIGDSVLFPASSIESDFAWAPAHPIADAYRAWKAMPYDAPAWGLAAALYAVRPQENYFKLSDPGAIQVLDDGGVRFAPSASGRHRYLIPDAAQRDRILKAYVELASAKPAPRPPRSTR